MEEMTIAILTTSDLHGNVLPLNYANNEEMEIGFSKISTLIKQERVKHNHTILIDNGDTIQGTPLAYHYAQTNCKSIHPMVMLLNDLQYDAAIIGNHEFNFGLELLHKVVDESQFPWLSANILNKETKEPFFGKPYIVKEVREGIKIGILGLTTHYIPNWEKPNHIQGIEFKDAVESAKKWVPFIRKNENVDLLIVSYHGGFERDLDTGEPTERLTGENQGYQLCEEVAGIDVLLTGHQHRQIAGKMIKDTIIVQPGSKGTNLGKVSVTFQKVHGKWQLKNKASNLISVKNVQPDPNIVSMIQPYEEKTQNWLDQYIGKIEGDMCIHDPLAIRLHDHALIEFFNKVQMQVAKVDISCTSLFNNDCPGLPNDVTLRDVLANYIYPNTLTVLRLLGQDIKNALEKTATYFAPYNGKEIKVNPSFLSPKPQHYNYDMWEGIDYEINISRPEWERITKLHYKGEPINLYKEYDVVMNNYRATGGGNYFMFQGKQVIREIQTDVPELIAEEIRRQGTVKATVNNNWKVVHD